MLIVFLPPLCVLLPGWMSLYLESMSSTLIQCFSIWLPTVFIEAHFHGSKSSNVNPLPSKLDIDNAFISGKCFPIWVNDSLFGHCVPIWPIVYLYMAQCLPVWPVVALSGQMSAYLELCLPIWPNFCLSGAMTAYVAKCLPIWSNVCLAGPMSPYLAQWHPVPRRLYFPALQ